MANFVEFLIKSNPISMTNEPVLFIIFIMKLFGEWTLGFSSVGLGQSKHFKPDKIKLSQSFASVGLSESSFPVVNIPGIVGGSEKCVEKKRY